MTDAQHPDNKTPPVTPTSAPATPPLSSNNRRSPLRPSHFLIVLGLALSLVAAMAYQTIYGRMTQPATDFEVKEGQSYFGLLPSLQDKVPLFSMTLAKLYIKLTATAPLKSGVYELPANPNLKQMLVAVQQAQKIDTVTVQIIEGKTAKELYRNIAKTDGIELTVLNSDGTPKSDLKAALKIDATTPSGKYADNLEGWFAPNTYEFAKGTTDAQILTDLYERQAKTLAAAWEGRAKDLPYKSPYEALIMASIIEKETSVPSERATVAAVFINRVRQGMRLQTDPTIIYGMGDRYDGNIRRADINEKTDYNTYQIDGLPPTPIALPSKASIEAAMHPEDTDVLYFVATGTGGHKFSKTLAEHNQAVQDYLAVMRQKRASEASQ